ncbi:cellulose synthase family protein [Desulfobulbus elongatus]|uniref:cellulose synthase family protein n=1 Tax=Desulfobulbus elongatus TaxID=53332 RepID=UPI000555C9C2|nr:cellulose synthase family protein [Desulfobulbus elongatus]
MHLLLGLYIVFLVLILAYNLLQLNLLRHYLDREKVKAAPPPADGDTPFVTVQLPLFNEPYVAERLIDNIIALDYPRDRFEVQILDDSTDDTTEICERKAGMYRDRGFDIRVIHRTDRTGFKAGALAEGLRQAKGEFVAIFDADFLPSPRFLRDTVPYFRDERVGVVQTRWAHLNSDYSLFTKLQALQLNVHFTIEQMGRKAGNHFLQFNGTAGIWRKRAIEDAGGWKADTLTEDLDLSFRAQLKQWQIVYLEDIEAPAELPAEMNGIKSQQFRWMKGGAENARRLAPLIMGSRLPLRTKLHALVHLANSSIFVATLMLALSSVALLPFLDDLEVDPRALSFSLLGLVGVAAVYFYANITLLPKPVSLHQVLALVGYFPLLLIMFMGLSFHNSVAVVEGYLGIKSSFVRTPKYNIVGRIRQRTDRDQKNPISNILIIEGLLALLFSAALLLAALVGNYSFFIFHLMLAIGFGIVFVVSWRDR